MKPQTMLLLALLAWAPGQAAFAQSEGSKVAACLNTSALLGMSNADAQVNEGRTTFPNMPTIGGEAYVAKADYLDSIPPSQLRYHAKLDDGEALFVLFGTALGAPGRLYVLASTDMEDGGCGFMRFNLRDRLMQTYRKERVWELIDRPSVTYENGVFEYAKIRLEEAPTPSNPAHVYTLRHESFRCPARVGLHRAVHMSEDGRGLWDGRFTGSDGEPSWGEVTADRLVPLQRFFCGNGADSRIATAFEDVAAALAAWRAEDQN